MSEGSAARLRTPTPRTRVASTEHFAGRLLVRVLALEIGVGVAALMVGALVYSWRIGSFAGAVATFLVPLTVTVAIAVLLLAGVALASSRVSLPGPRGRTRLTLFTAGGRARTGLAATVTALLAAGLGGAVFEGSDGFVAGLLAAVMSGYVFFACALGLLWGGGQRTPALSTDRLDPATGR